MYMRLAILVVAVVTAVAVLIYRGLPRVPWTSQSEYASSTGHSRTTEPVTPLRADSSLRFEVLHERVMTPYRLRPDRRLLLAVAEIRRLAGAPDSTVTAQFAGGQW